MSPVSLSHPRVYAGEPHIWTKTFIFTSGLTQGGLFWECYVGCQDAHGFGTAKSLYSGFHQKKITSKRAGLTWPITLMTNDLNLKLVCENYCVKSIQILRHITWQHVQPTPYRLTKLTYNQSSLEGTTNWMELRPKCVVSMHLASVLWLFASKFLSSCRKHNLETAKKRTNLVAMWVHTLRDGVFGAGRVLVI